MVVQRVFIPSPSAPPLDIASPSGSQESATDQEPLDAVRTDTSNGCPTSFMPSPSAPPLDTAPLWDSQESATGRSSSEWRTIYLSSDTSELKAEAKEIQFKIASITACNALCGNRATAVYSDRERDRWYTWNFISIYCFTSSSSQRKASKGEGLAILCGFIVATALSTLCINLVNHLQHRNMAIDIEIFENKVGELDDNDLEKAKFKKSPVR